MAADDNDDVHEERLRFSDIADEPRRMLPPIEGFEKMPLVPLEEAVKPLVKYIHNLEDYVRSAKKKCPISPADGLSVDESASIRLYTMEWKPRDQCLYFVLNKTLRAEDRNLLKDWFLYLKLIIHSLLKLPPTTGPIFRGVKLNLLKEYPTGQNVVWWGFSSCSKSMQVLEKGPFLGKTGVRTLFEIDCYSGRNICQHSAYPKENEVLLLAATYFQIVSSLDAGDGLRIIHLKEAEPEFSLIEKSWFVHASPPTPANHENMTSVVTPPSPISLQFVTDSTDHNPDLEQYIARFPRRSNVSLDGQQLTDEDMPLVVQQAIVNKECVKLSLQSNRLTSYGIRILARGVSESPTLEELNLSQNYLSDEHIISLTRELSVPRMITVEQWKCCGIAKVKELEKAPIKTLNLSHNNIGDDGARYLAELLKIKRTLVELHLNDNQISDRGVQQLSSALCQPHTNLLKLYLHNNPRISDKSADDLAKMLKQNRALKVLWLINCGLTNNGRERLQEAIASKKNFYLNVERFA